jgi:hypothetical protein
MNKLNYCLTDADMKRLIPFEVPIFHYSQLKSLNSVFELTSLNNAAIIYFETERQGGTMCGHWTCLTMSPKSKSIDSTNDLSFSINFFDSYGVKPDDEKEEISEENLRISGMVQDVLTKLLYDASDDITIEYNEKPLQSRKKGVNTCGRHVVARIMAVDTPLDQYQRFMRLKGSSADDKVMEITTPILLNKARSDDVADKFVKLINSV